jgi:hypothetical protein
LLRFKKDNISINYSNLGWRISNNLSKRIKDNLRVEILKWSQSYAEELSHKLDLKCESRVVNIGSNTMRPLYTQNNYTLKSTNEREASIAIPSNGKEDFSLVSLFGYTCNKSDK